jgi:UDP-N-acetylglucosamine--N-acetylmuramyl-(pentapeptide) pyrophosphoryl-undecaprenol N-acetylglucosamine transferase
MLIVPYPHAGAHQERNAERLAEAGAAKVIPDHEFDAAALLAAAAGLADSEALGRNRVAARSFGRPGAADAIASMLLALAERRSLPSQADLDRLAGVSQ